MDGLLAYLPSYALDKTQWLVALLAVLFTAFAARLVRQFVLSEREAPLNYHVERPQELASDWKGKEWGAVGDGKEILAAQLKGVCTACPSGSWKGKLRFTDIS